MNRRDRKVERIPKIMAPINSLEGAVRVIHAGADEIYCGVALPSKFKNFFLYRGPGASPSQVSTYDDLGKIVEYAHRYRPRTGRRDVRRVEVVLVVNEPFMSEAMESEVKDHIRSCLDTGVDALLIGDMGVFSVVKDMGVRVPLYASTYFASMNHESTEFFRKLGFSRVVLERHLTIHEISEIVNRSRVDIEVFCHAGGCSNINTSCYFYHIHIPPGIEKHLGSYFRDRERVVGPCSMDYEIYDVSNGDKICKAPILDAITECSLCYLQALVSTGVTGIKIVGRCENVPTQERYTRWYRELLDLITRRNYQLKPEILREKIDSTIKEFEGSQVFCKQKRCYFSPLFNVPYKSFIS